MIPRFVVVNRNPGHWDIWNDTKRLYRIRGKSGNVTLMGDHEFSTKPIRTYQSVESCMLDIITEFMKESEEQ